MTVQHLTRLDVHPAPTPVPQAVEPILIFGSHACSCNQSPKRIKSKRRDGLTVPSPVVAFWRGAKGSGYGEGFLW